MKKKHILYLIFVSLSIVSFSQETTISKANTKYDEFAYIQASEIYLRVVKSGFKSAEILLKLGNTYYFNANYKEAVTWYDDLYKNFANKHTNKKYLLRYAQSLKAVGKKKQSEKIYNEFLKVTKVNNTELKSSEDYLNIIEENSNRYSIAPININSKHVDFGSFYKNDTLYFASTRNYRKGIKRIDTWNNDNFLDIYTSVLDTSSNKFSKPELIKGAINSKYHESTPIITKDGNTMYFTRSNDTFLEETEEDPISRLKIYRATKVNGSWRDFEDLTINSETYSTAHPVLSPDEKMLFFVSDMPSSIGMTDIYSVPVYDNGKLGEYKNLGASVNTKGRESFPFISSKNELYFSSDGHFGLGGYDVFYIDLLAKDEQLVNIGKPINSSKDDFAFFIDNTTSKGFFTSNISGTDNIYTLKETKSIQKILKLKAAGVVTIKNSNTIIPDAKVIVTNKDGVILETTKTEKNGKFTVLVNRFKPFIVRVVKAGYSTEDIFVSVKRNTTLIHLGLEKEIIKIEENKDLAKELNITIYYDFDSSDIRNSEKVQLEKIVAVLKSQPSINIQLNSHTDSKGENTYNLRLSNARAKKAVAYLVSRGIQKERLQSKGYGETLPIKACVNPQKCTKEEDQKNRRTEFIIKK